VYFPKKYARAAFIQDPTHPHFHARLTIAPIFDWLISDWLILDWSISD